MSQQERITPDQMDEDRMDRSRRIVWLNVPAIEASNVLIVGAGALGNEVVKDLVLSGCKNITLVDMDHVVRSNLNRCVFFREEDADERRMKADIVAKRAMELEPAARIIPVNGKVQDMDWKAMSEFDVVFGCLDNIAARLHLNAQSYFAKVPYVDGGTDGFSGKVQVVVPPRTPCLQCAMNQSHYKVMQKRFSCTGADVVYHERKMAAEITTTSVIAALQVREGLKLLSGRDEECIRHVHFYNGLQGTSESYELSIDPNCPNHLA
ncbi:MAG: putative adenylyltransferase [Methanomassiliicoccales archaeon PtaU1.Bin124]|nr:MAG: putative adenylyltransferase [Methanomassiliicoccales archaeon PtaU1.Bin124]